MLKVKGEKEEKACIGVQTGDKIMLCTVFTKCVCVCVCVCVLVNICACTKNGVHIITVVLTMRESPDDWLLKKCKRGSVNC